MNDILSGWRKRIEALSDERFDALIVAYIAWFDEGLLTEPEASKEKFRREWTDFMMEADPIMTEDGLAGFINMYVPK